MPYKPKSHSQRQYENSPFKDFYDRQKKENKKRYDDKRGTAAERGYDSKWRQVRALYLKRFPLCADCQDRQIVTAAEEVHHLIKIKDRPDLAYRFDNLKSLCRACHNRRTAAGE